MRLVFAFRERVDGRYRDLVREKLLEMGASGAAVSEAINTATVRYDKSELRGTIVDYLTSCAYVETRTIKDK